MKRMLVLFAVMAAFAVAAGTAFAAGPFSLFGGAQALRVGNSWVYDLPSTSTPDVPFSGIAFTQPNGRLTFGDLWQLSTDYTVTTGNCGGGSPRFSIGIDTNGDGTTDGHIFVYIGDTPNFTCNSAQSAWQSTGNLIGNTDLRFDATQLGGAFYGSYAAALAAFGSDPVTSLSLVVDGVWKAPQDIQVKNVMVNNFLLNGNNAD